MRYFNLSESKITDKCNMYLHDNNTFPSASSRTENYKIIWDRNKLDNIGLNKIARTLNFANAIFKILHLHMQQI